MENNLKFLLIVMGLLILTSCFKTMNMTTYQKLPKIETIKDFEKNYGETVKLFGVLINGPLKNKKVVVAESVFHIKLSDDMLVLLPTRDTSTFSLSRLQRLTGKEIFVVGQPVPPGYPLISTYEGLKTPLFIPQGFITLMNDAMLTEPQITDLKTINTYRGYMEGQDNFFAYVIGTMTQKIDLNQEYPLTTTVLLQDKTPFEVTINEKLDIDILGYVGEKIFIRGKVKTKIDQASITEAQVSNYEKYMDYYSTK